MLKAHAASHPGTEKIIEQGAASSVWAATSADLGGKGGSYIQDCSVAVPCETAGSAVMFDGMGAKPAPRAQLLFRNGQSHPV